MEKRERNSAIELLRIATIILIIFHHFNVHGIRGGKTFLRPAGNYLFPV